MATLSIIKYSNKVWKFLASDVPTGANGFSFSKLQADSDGLDFFIVSQGGATTNRYQLANVTVYPSVGGVPEIGWTSMQELLLRLEELNFPAWNAVSGSGGATAFIQLTDVPDDYTSQGGKVVAVKEDETGLEFIEGGGGSTPTLQEVLDEGKTATFTDVNDVLTGISLGEYEEDNLRSSIYFNQSRTFEDVEQSTLFFQELGLLNLQTYIYDLLTNISKVGSISSGNGDVTIFKQDGFESFSKNQSITFEDVTTEPADNLDIVYKPNPKIVSGTYYLATLDDIPTIDATPTDGSSNAVSSNGVFDALALKETTIFDNVGGSVVNVDSTPTIIYTFPISADTFNNTTLADISFAIERVGTGSPTSLNVWMYASTSNVTLGNQFAYYANSAISRLTFSFVRRFEISSNLLDPFKFPIGTGLLSNIGTIATSGTPTTIAFDPTVQMYIHIVASHTTVAGNIQVIGANLKYIK